MLKKAVAAAGGGITRQVLLQLALPLAIGVPVWCLYLTATSVSVSAGNADPDTSVLGALICGPFILFGAVAGWIGISALLMYLWNRRAVERQASTCEAAFESVGLKVSGSNSEGRRYVGVVNMKPVSVYLYPGPTVDFHVQTPLQVFVSVLEKDRLLRSVNSVMFQKQPHDPSLPQLSQFDVYAADSDWAYKFLSESRVQDIILRLMARPGETESRHVRLESSGALLKLDRTDLRNITTANVQRWLVELITLIEIAESLAPPQTLAEVTPFRSDGQLYTWTTMLPFRSGSVSMGILSALLYPLMFCGSLYLVACTLINAWAQSIGRWLEGPR